jgi:hypothetical protein
MSSTIVNAHSSNNICSDISVGFSLVEYAGLYRAIGAFAAAPLAKSYSP